MKKKNVFVHALVITVLLAMMAGCASTRTQSSTGELVDDTVITTKIKSMLAADAFLKSFQLSVETFQGSVQLSGLWIPERRPIEPLKSLKVSRVLKTLKTILSLNRKGGIG